jgi:hypothetical protein
MTRIFALLTALVIPSAATPASLADFSNRDVVAALKEALTKSSDAAVSRLGVENGFFGDERVKIPLPDSLKRAERVMRSIGMGKQADDLVLRMNRAAEAAVPEARTLLVDAVRKMSIQDAKSVLTGGDDAATQYFRRTTSGPLTQKFLPKVQDAMSRVRFAETYDAFAQRGRRLGLLKDEDANLESYITRKALDGLFVVMAEEEKKIRQDPVGTASSIIRKVFGALRD